MLGVRKPFDKEMHDQTDEAGKNATLEFINRNLADKPNLRTIENPDQYGIDLLTLNEKDEVIACWEVEVRFGNWKGDRDFPFDTINCIERKDHMWKKENSFTDKIPFPVTSNCKVYYVQLNDLCNRFAIIESANVLKCRLRPWSNRFQQGEMVRQVPLKWVKQARL
jgi:hypothetical protein